MDNLEIKQKIAQIVEQQNDILNQLQASERPKKDTWDKLNCVAPIISGLLIGGFGSFIGYSYNQQQIKLQEAETIERFIPHLAGNEKTKKAAIIAMSSLTNTALAAKMASLFASEGTVSALESIAQTSNLKDRTVANQALASSLSNMAQRSLDENNLNKAELYFRKAIVLNEKLDGQDSADLCDNLDRLANVYISRGQLTLAEPLLRRSLALKENNVGYDRQSLHQSMRNLADILEQKGNTAEATLWKKKAVASEESLVASTTQDKNPDDNNKADRQLNETVRLKVNPIDAENPIDADLNNNANKNIHQPIDATNEQPAESP